MATPTDMGKVCRRGAGMVRRDAPYRPVICWVVMLRRDAPNPTRHPDRESVPRCPGGRRDDMTIPNLNMFAKRHDFETTNIVIMEIISYIRIRFY